MSHDERVKLIKRPFPTVHIYGGRVWGGVSVNTRDIPISPGTRDDDQITSFDSYSDWSRE